MSRKLTYVSAQEIKKTFAAGNSAGRTTGLAKSDFKLKKHTGAKSPFGVASACATGTVYGALGIKD